MNLFDIYASEPLSRLLFGSGLLFLAIMTHSMLLSLLLLVLSAVLIYILDGHGLTNLRIMRLLHWFIIPIILLHTLFSPGRLLWPDFFIPMSREGLIQGTMLSLHLSVIFFVAILLFRLLKRSEWLRYMIILPCLGKQLVIYVWMMSCMKMNNRSLLGDLRLQFRLRKDMKSVPLLLISAFRQSLNDASEHACTLWLRWPAHMRCLSPVSMQQRAPEVHYDAVSLLLASVGFTAFLWPWM